MANIMFLLAALLFAFGVLIGSGLHTQAVDRQYRQVAHRVRELRKLEDALAEQEEVLARSNRPRASYQDTQLEHHVLTLADNGCGNVAEPRRAGRTNRSDQPGAHVEGNQADSGQLVDH
jgi:hypothetical protein